MYQQRTLFDGFMRIEIFDHLTNHKLICQDVINLCNMFYELNIASLTQTEDQEKEFYSLPIACTNNEEYFIAYELLKMLSTYNSKNLNYVEQLALVSSQWNLWSEAKPLYQKLIKLKPNNAVYRDQYAKGLAHNNEYKLALEQATKATEIEPENKEYIAGHIVCYQLVKNYKNIWKCWEKMVAVDADNAHYRYEYGLALLQLRDYKEALQQFLEALRLDNEEWRMAKCAFGSAVCYIGLGDFQNATKYFHSFFFSHDCDRF